MRVAVQTVEHYQKATYVRSGGFRTEPEVDEQPEKLIKESWDVLVSMLPSEANAIARFIKRQVEFDEKADEFADSIAKALGVEL